MSNYQSVHREITAFTFSYNYLHNIHGSDRINRLEKIIRDIVACILSQQKQVQTSIESPMFVVQFKAKTHINYISLNKLKKKKTKNFTTKANQLIATQNSKKGSSNKLTSKSKQSSITSHKTLKPNHPTSFLQHHRGKDTNR